MEVFRECSSEVLNEFKKKILNIRCLLKKIFTSTTYYNFFLHKEIDFFDDFEAFPLIELTDEVAKKLIKRVDEIKLYAHSYAFNINMNHAGENKKYDAIDILDFAKKINYKEFIFMLMMILWHTVKK